MLAIKKTATNQPHSTNPGLLLSNMIKSLIFLISLVEEEEFDFEILCDKWKIKVLY